MLSRDEIVRKIRENAAKEQAEAQAEQRAKANSGTHAKPAAQPTPLAYVDLARDPIPERKWAVRDRIPAGNVTLLSGEGAVGKSILLLQLAAAHVLGKDWIGTMPELGPVLYLSCEDDDDEVCRRLELIAQHYQSTRIALQDAGLRVICRVGEDSLLGIADRNDRICATPLFAQLETEIATMKPVSVIIDTAADTFAGNEISRAQTRQFITLLRGLILDTDAAVILSAHPSLTGISSDSGLSGSTAWHNSVRARMYFKRASDEDKELRVLEVRKNNYGPEAENILLRWRNGVYSPEPNFGSFEQLAAKQKASDLFLTLLRRFHDQDRNVSDQRSPSYAPTVFAQEPEATAAKVKASDFAAAMTRLFADNKIRVVEQGPPSRRRRRVVEVSAFNPPLMDGACEPTPRRPNA